ncbi:hypothetical protein [Paraburkholderia azotifigens]|uniref:Uncharacterized protein n=1 Tax=Paraburkholderia azotifigens TaxID=2057004 RepID=A0A5C6VCN0_9BURK|nr:hypothetical protein [Paraburkholderia azotifigens]TXC82521.1 hypothetical protein FRZ40_18810 [Paraburkholderia azotifigens]
MPAKEQIADASAAKSKKQKSQKPGTATASQTNKQAATTHHTTPWRAVNAPSAATRSIAADSRTLLRTEPPEEQTKNLIHIKHLSQ